MEKVRKDHQLNFIRMCSQLKSMVNKGDAKHFVGVAADPTKKPNWEFLKNLIQENGNVHTAWMRHHEVGDPEPPAVTKDEDATLRSTLLSLHDQEATDSREKAAFALLFAYITSVVPDELHISIEAIANSDANRPPREIYAETMAHLKTEYQKDTGNVRAYILGQMDGIGMADTKSEMSTLVASHTHWFTMLEQFDSDNATGYPPIPIVERMQRLLMRTKPEGSIAHIRRDLEKIKTDSTQTWAVVVAKLKLACQGETKTIDEIILEQEKQAAELSRAEPVTTHNVAIAAVASSTGMPTASAVPQDHHVMTGWPQQQQVSSGGFQGFHGPAWGHTAYGISSSQPMQYFPQGPNGGQMPYYQPHDQQQSAFVSYEQPQQHQSFQGAQGWGGAAGYTQQQGSSQQPQFPAPAGECVRYPYCDSSSRKGCTFRHVPRAGFVPSQEEDTQRWQDEQLQAGCSGGSRKEGGGPHYPFKRAELTGVRARDTSGGTPYKGPAKHGRYDV